MKSDKIRIMIVEDERLPATYLSELLSKEGYEVVAICNEGDDAVRKARKYHPDIVFMDIMLKGEVSGCEAALRIGSELPRTKILFLTAYIDEEMISYASEAGACNYLLKPYNDAQILATLKLIASQQRDARTIVRGRFKLLHLGGAYFYDTHTEKIYADTKELLLSAKKRKLISLLVKAEGRCVSYDDLCISLFDDANRYGALRTLVSRLNRTLGFSLVENVPQQGYRIQRA